MRRHLAQERPAVIASVAALLLLLLALPAADIPPGARAQPVGDPVVIVVAIPGDGVAGATCPGETCTLRAALAAANANESRARIVILFDGEFFPVANPATIALVAPLPPVTRDFVTVNAGNRGVRIDGSALAGDAVDGLVFDADGAIVHGLTVTNFSGACIAVNGPNAGIGGDPSLLQGNRVHHCGTGILVRGSGARLSGNIVGALGPEAGLTAGGIGILVNGGGTVVGLGRDEPFGYANRIGNVSVGVQVGDGAGAPFSATRIAGNVFGRTEAGTSAPLGTAVFIRQPSNGTAVESNVIRAATTAGIRVADTAGGVDTTGNTFSANRFLDLAPGALAIDLRGDGQRNPNDTGDADGGPNLGLNHPLILRATTARIQGNAGNQCDGCLVQLYFAHHLPGGQGDYGSEPVPVADAIADFGGNFVFESPPVTAGSWVMAVVIDEGGNTSEFGPSAYVGTGSVTCGPTQLRAGWNHAPYLGEQRAIGEAFPPGQPGAVTAIYQYVDGSGEWRHWFPGSDIGRTLHTLHPGEPYFFYAVEPVTLEGGFALTQPFPVQVVPGWNDIVYIGSPGDVRDAFGTIGHGLEEVLRFVNDDFGGRWQAWGGEEVPGYARAFHDIQPCRVYQLEMSAPGILTPLQP